MSSNRMKILITGATGFIGQHLCRHLLAKGYKVCAIGRQEHFKISHPACEYHKVENMDDIAAIQPLLVDIDVVIHLAARVHQVHSKGMKDLALYLEANVKSTQIFAKAAIAANVKRFIYLSTIKVNGEKTIDMPYRADDQPQPQDAYSHSKWKAEQILQEESRRSGMEWVIIRPPLVYGSGVKGNFRRLLNVAKNRIPLPLANIKNKRSLVSVDNLCSFIECCLSHPNAQGEVFLVSDNHDLSTPELITQLRKLYGKGAWLFPFPIILLKVFGSIFGKRKEIDRLVDSLQANTGKTERLLQWKPPLTVSESFAKLIKEEEAVIGSNTLL